GMHAQPEGSAHPGRDAFVAGRSARRATAQGARRRPMPRLARKGWASAQRSRSAAATLCRARRSSGLLCSSSRSNRRSTARRNCCSRAADSTLSRAYRAPAASAARRKSAEYPPIDFVHHQHKLPIRRTPGEIAECFENPGAAFEHQLSRSTLLWPETLDEILVAVRRMESATAHKHSRLFRSFDFVALAST